MFHTSQLLSWLSEVAEANDQAWLFVDSKWRILFETGQAANWLTEYFGHNGSLPGQLRDWLKRRALAHKGNDGFALTLQDFSIQRGSKVLTVRSLSSAGSAEHRLLLAESSEELDAQPLQALGLTKREAEVLLWISQGKRNGEIAGILQTSERTVTKHVERILSKLGVETRTAAASVAFQVFGTITLRFSKEGAAKRSA
jgi:DNA-binding CsgD family transcriptional regulator